jgi:PIN domain nuclease of toxin-antitoxin system
MPRLLLDTHVFLWWIDDAPELTPKARRAIADAQNECSLSVASCWDLAIKSSLGKIRFAVPIEQFLSEHLAANGITLLDITLRHATRVENMPFHHRDPFDRLIIAQALTEKMTIVSADKTFSRYGAKVLW